MGGGGSAASFPTLTTAATVNNKNKNKSETNTTRSIRTTAKKIRRRKRAIYKDGQIGNASSSTTARKKGKRYKAQRGISALQGQEEGPQCVVCLKILAAVSMKATKIKRHLETRHPDHVNKPLEFPKVGKCDVCTFMCLHTYLRLSMRFFQTSVKFCTVPNFNFNIWNKCTYLLICLQNAIKPHFL